MGLNTVTIRQQVSCHRNLCRSVTMEQREAFSAREEKKKTVTLLRSRKAHTRPTHAVPGNLERSIRAFHRRKARHDQLGLRVRKMTEKICEVCEPCLCSPGSVHLNVVSSRINVFHSSCLPHVDTNTFNETYYGDINKRKTIDI